jgi:hypothetical protein
MVRCSFSTSIAGSCLDGVDLSLAIVKAPF